MRDSASQAQGVVFDFGTSPHGLAAEPRQTVEEARQAAAPHSLADGFDRAAHQASERSSEAPMPRRQDPAGQGGALAPTVAAGQAFTFTEDQRCNLAYAALCHITTLEDSDESEEPEVQRAIRLLIEARDILMDGRWQL